MKIDVVCFDLSHNALGRAYLLADLARVMGARARIIGLQNGPSIWAPLRGEGRIEIVPIPSGLRYPEALEGCRKVARALDADVVYVSKLRVPSYGSALMGRFFYDSGARILLDIDDWELGSLVSLSGFQVIEELANAINANTLVDTYIIEKLYFIADAITVSTTFLRNRFGGTILPHVRDTDFLNPARFDRSRLRESYGVGDEFVIAFLGTILPHKGVDILLEALPGLERIGARLLLITGERTDPGIIAKIDGLGDRVLRLPEVPYSRLPELYAISDLVVLLQKKTPFAIAQLPMKLLDAMAMAKPIIATGVSDIPLILSGDCGVVLDTYDVRALREAILALHGDPERRARMGENARRKCVRRYSYRAGVRTLRRVVSGLF